MKDTIFRMKTELKKFKEMFEQAEKLPLGEALSLISNFKEKIADLTPEENEKALRQVPDRIQFLTEKATQYKNEESSNAACEIQKPSPNGA